MGGPHIGSYRIFSHPMNNASQRSPLPLNSPLLRLDLTPILFSISLSFSHSHSHSLTVSLVFSRASLSRVAFRNLFVIKAAIYFTLIEKIGRLPLAATIYHHRTRLVRLSSRFLTSAEDYNAEDVCTGVV